MQILPDVNLLILSIKAYQTKVLNLFIETDEFSTKMTKTSKIPTINDIDTKLSLRVNLQCFAFC